MKRRFWLLLVLATLVFVLSAASVLYGLAHGSVLPMWFAAGGMAVSAVLFLLAIFLPRRRVDWDRIHAEQRLWESGPLGRTWLRIRQRLSDLWKI